MIESQRPDKLERRCKKALSKNFQKFFFENYNKRTKYFENTKKNRYFAPCFVAHP